MRLGDGDAQPMLLRSPQLAGLLLAGLALAALASDAVHNGGGGRALWALPLPLRPAPLPPPPLPPLPRKTIVIAHYKEDLNWSVAFARSGWHIVVYSKVPTAAVMFQELVAAADLNDADRAEIEVIVDDENWGEEAMPYLRFLAAHGDAPPPLTAFVHGDPTAHSPFLADQLSCASEEFAEGYFPLSGLHIDANALLLPPRPDEAPDVALLRGPVPPTTPTMTAMSLPEERPYFQLIRDKVNDEFAARGVDAFIEPVVGVSFVANAQFVVTAAAVRRRPRAFWEALLHVGLTVRSFTADAAHIPPRKTAAFFFEALWHELFKRPRLLPWREADAFCGDDSGVNTPLRRACCDAEEHAAFRAMLGTPRVVRAVQKAHVWSWREGHKAP